MINHWLDLSIARKIAQELQKAYCGVFLSDVLPYEIHNDLYNHPLHNPRLTNVNIHRDCFDCVSWIQVGTGFLDDAHDFVPR